MARSLLFVPGDSSRKLDRASQTAADALILDLEDSVSPDEKAKARQLCKEHLKDAGKDKQLWVRINALDTEHALEDLASVIPQQPYGIILPKCEGAAVLLRASNYLDAFETSAGVLLGQTRILPIITETAVSMFRAAEYQNVTSRLWGISWGAEDLAADIAAESNRVAGRYTEPFRLARSLCLFAAAAAGVRAIDTVCVDLDDDAILLQETEEARRDGFSGKMLIHPRHIETVNSVFSPSEKQLHWAREVIAAFEASPSSGTLRLNGKMIDIPHLRLARRLLQKEES